MCKQKNPQYSCSSLIQLLVIYLTQTQNYCELCLHIWPCNRIYITCIFLWTVVVSKSCFKELFQRVISKSCFKELFQRVISKSYFKELFQRVISKSYFKELFQRVVSKSCCNIYWLFDTNNLWNNYMLITCYIRVITWLSV